MVLTNSVLYWIASAKLKIKCIIWRKIRMMTIQLTSRTDQRLIFLSPSKSGNGLWTHTGQFTYEVQSLNQRVFGVFFFIGRRIACVHCVGETKNVYKKIYFSAEQSQAKILKKNPCEPHTRTHIKNRLDAKL